MLRSLISSSSKTQIFKRYFSTSLKWDMEVDIAVVGFGAAGASAALEATNTNSNAKVLIIDRFQGGGASKKSGGIVYAGGGTKMQKKLGIKDDVENFFQYLKMETEGCVDDQTLRDFCEQSAANFEWLENNGVNFSPYAVAPFRNSFPPLPYTLCFSGNEMNFPFTESAYPAPRGHRSLGTSPHAGYLIFDGLKKAILRSSNVIFKPHTWATKLIQNEQGEIIGISTKTISNPIKAFLHDWLEKPATYVLFQSPLSRKLTEWIEKGAEKGPTIKVNKGVILSSGGFGFNVNMLKEHAPSFTKKHFKCAGTLGDSGSGIQLGESVGGKTDRLHKISSWYFHSPPLNFLKGIIVNKEGKRIVDESRYGGDICNVVSEKYDSLGFIVYDKKIREEIFRELTEKKSGIWSLMRLQAYNNLYTMSKSSDTLEGIAKKFGINAEVLKETIEKYNKSIREKKEDEFNKNNAHRQEIIEPPFYCLSPYNTPLTFITLGGLVVDGKSGLVIHKENGKPIKKLYAAGRTAVGIPSNRYMSGLSIADCVFSGRRAGRHAASI